MGSPTSSSQQSAIATNLPEEVTRRTLKYAAGSPAAVRFSYAAQATAGSKCAGLLDVSPGAEVQACTFTFP